jgi:hypothetical protein
MELKKQSSNLCGQVSATLVSFQDAILAKKGYCRWRGSAVRRKTEPVDGGDGGRCYKVLIDDFTGKAESDVTGRASDSNDRCGFFPMD